MRVIFLDIDGVLNYDGSTSRNGIYLGIDNKRMRYLRNIVLQTDAKIVLTSTWREFYKIGAYKQDTRTGIYLNNKMRRHGLEIYDKVSEEVPWNHRGEAIKLWLDQHPDVEAYVVIDDEIFRDYNDYDIMPHLIKTCSNLTDKLSGLTERLTFAAVAILQGYRIGPVIDYDILRNVFSGFEPEKENYFNFN